MPFNYTYFRGNQSGPVGPTNLVGIHVVTEIPNDCCAQGIVRRFRTASKVERQTFSVSQSAPEVGGSSNQTSPLIGASSKPLVNANFLRDSRKSIKPRQVMAVRERWILRRPGRGGLPGYDVEDAASICWRKASDMRFLRTARLRCLSSGKPTAISARSPSEISTSWRLRDVSGGVDRFMNNPNEGIMYDARANLKVKRAGV